MTHMLATSYTTDLPALSGQEWLETNGRGAYASTTVADCHTRKYHGLLVSGLADLPGRYVLLSHLEAMVLVGEEEYNVATNYYPGAIHPQGHTYIREFSLEPCPTHVFALGEMTLNRQVVMVQGEDAVYLCYELDGPVESVSLQLKPLLVHRNSHELASENMFLNTRGTRVPHGVSFTPYPGMSPTVLQFSEATEFYAGPCWEQSVQYPREAERGFDCTEDRFFPGIFELTLKRGTPLWVRASTAPVDNVDSTLPEAELARRVSNIDTASDDFERAASRLHHSAGQFFVDAFQEGASVVAGYPWFGAWGRDTMIALPGLAFTGQDDPRGLRVLEHAAEYLSNGLLPNTFGGLQGNQEYNSVDASLWYAWAIQQYDYCCEGRDDVKARLFTALEAMVGAYLNDEVGIARLDDNGLIDSGDEHTQLTWMDARAWGEPVTPRFGLAVEINALWYNALGYYLELVASGAKADTDISQRVESLFGALPAAFERIFWLDDQHYLADCVNKYGVDKANRPNQIFAVSLPFSPLSEERQRAVVKKVRETLWTPYGLRTLDPGHPDYRGRYEGSGDERDSRYHQGTVWPWLMGGFVEASLRVAYDAKATAEDLLQQLKPLMVEHIEDYGLGSLAEVFDGDAPHRPAGCFSQAWSVSELLRAYALIKSELGR